MSLPASRPIRRGQLATLFAAPAGFTVLAYGAALLVFDQTAVEHRNAVAQPPPNGAALYARHCASCHGVTGDGYGPAQLEPRARAFGADKYKFAGTTNGVPTDADLLRLLRRGIPGSAMPAFARPPEGQPPTGAAVVADLTDDELSAIIGHVRELTRAGAYAAIRRKIESAGEEDFDPEKASRKAEELSRPGPVLPIPPLATEPTTERLANGKRIYGTVCASCHGPDGKGDGPQVKEIKNEDGTPNRPRDLTAGLFKAGGDPDRLYTRIRLGIPGTPMPATSTLSDAEVGDLIAFVRSLSGRK